jgi:peptide-methionine (S)-S-oxide reductase
MTTQSETAILAAGCFWGVEETFRQLDGVIDTEVGYTGGQAENPSYEEVCGGRTGHAEAVRVTFDPARLSYDALLAAFWEAHDPTQMNRQGPDVGTQYRSAIFTLSDEQARAAQASKEKAQARVSRPIATAIEPAGPFWRAEEYHQRYLEKRGGGVCHIPPRG